MSESQEGIKSGTRGGAGILVATIIYITPVCRVRILATFRSVSPGLMSFLEKAKNITMNKPSKVPSIHVIIWIQFYLRHLN